jgi:hypothetical protein
MTEANNAGKPGGSGNTDGLKKAVRKAFKTILDVKGERQNLNAKLAEMREMLVQQGVSKKVFAMAQTYLALDQEDRDAFNEFFDIFKEVIDTEFQPDLLKQ